MSRRWGKGNCMPSEKAWMQMWRDRGYTVTDIAKAYNRSIATVSNQTRAPIQVEVKVHTPLSAQSQIDLQARRDAGLTLKEIGDEIGRSVAFVCTHTKPPAKPEPAPIVKMQAPPTAYQSTFIRPLDKKRLMAGR